MIARPASRCAATSRCARPCPNAALSRSEACPRNAATRPQSSSPAYGRGTGNATTGAATIGDAAR